MNAQKIILFSLILLASIAFLIWRLKPAPDPYEPQLDQCLGAKLGVEIARLLNGQLADSEHIRKTVEEECGAIGALPAVLLRRAFSGEL